MAIAREKNLLTHVKSIFRPPSEIHQEVTGGSCSSSRCPSECLARSGPISSWRNGACARRCRWTGRATSLSRAASSLSWWPSPTASSPTARTRSGSQSPRVLGCFAAGIVLIAAFFRIERKTTYPMFRLQLFKIRAFLFGSIATFLSALARGGLQFMLIIWLQGIWLPLHG